jgi:hypothetical protein
VTKSWAIIGLFWAFFRCENTLRTEEILIIQSFDMCGPILEASLQTSHPDTSIHLASNVLLSKDFKDGGKEGDDAAVQEGYH